MQPDAISIRNLTVRYQGSDRYALEDLSFQVEAGQFYGLLGPNGAGKTTLISFICGQIEGSYNSAKILGRDRVNLTAYKSHLGYAPQEIALYPMLSARQNLGFFAKLLRAEDGAVERVLDWIGLMNSADDRVDSFSGGMKRRLNLGVALLNKPKLLILDEPTVGVDPQSRGFIFEKILELKRQGITLIYSTHYLEEVKRLCDTVGILNEGRLIASGPIDTVLGSDIESRYLDLTGRMADG